MEVFKANNTTYTLSQNCDYIYDTALNHKAVDVDPINTIFKGIFENVIYFLSLEEGKDRHWSFDSIEECNAVYNWLKELFIGCRLGVIFNTAHTINIDPVKTVIAVRYLELLEESPDTWANSKRITAFNFLANSGFKRGEVEHMDLKEESYTLNFVDGSTLSLIECKYLKKGFYGLVDNVF